MIRFLSVVTISLLFAEIAMSKHLSPDEALSRLADTSISRVASQNPGNRMGYELVRSVKSADGNDAALYLFADANKRFVAVSADDVAPALLGYFDSEDSDLNADSFPPALEWWLQEYASQIQYGQANPGKLSSPSSVSRAPIEYMVKTRWNQSYPYNAQCPMFGDQQAVTGCVATAFAQVMNYHQWPEQGRGMGAIDFSEITFDWDSMLDEYDDDAERESASVVAVSTLMKACGYSVMMDYGVNWSGAYTGYIVDAAPEYFDYADEMYYAERRNYTSAQWEDLVYSQLAQGLPLIYSGRDGNWSDSVGHCFICDGYDGDGYYHFNWGWGGYCDGWFLLSALVPKGVGIGGAAGGYDYSQSLIANFHPSNTVINPSNGYVSRSMKGSNYDKNVYADIYPERVSLAPAELNFGLEFLSGGNRVMVADLGNTALSYQGYYSPAYKLKYDILNEMGLEDGIYDIRFVYKEDDEWKMLMWGYNHTKSLTIDLNAEDIVISDTPRIYPVVISDVDFNGCGRIIKNCVNELTYTATNTSDEGVHWMSWQHIVQAGESIPGQSVYSVNLDLLPGESRKIYLSIPANSMRNFETEKEYYFMFRGGEEGGSIIYADQDVTYRVVDPATDGISDGTFSYLEMNEGNLLMTGLASGVSRLSGDVVLPDQVDVDGTTYQVSSMIGSLTNLLDIKNVTSLDIRTPIKEIPADAFEFSEKLQSISFPSSLETIGDYAFVYCINLKGELKFPESLASIGRGAFFGCSGLTESLEFPASVKSIGIDAFFGCFGLNGELKLPQEITTIAPGTFDHCYYLKGSLEIPASVTSIGKQAFRACGELTGSLVIPAGVTSIGDYAFQDCVGFTDVTILADEVPEIGEDALPSVTTYVATGAGDRYREKLNEYSDSIYEIGDANMSQSLTVADAVAVINEIIGVHNACFDFKCGDINRDGRISISDATMTVSCVLKYNPEGIADSAMKKIASPANSGRIIADLSGFSGDGKVDLILQEAGDIVAVQADIILDAGLEIDDIQLAESLRDSHTLQFSRMSNGVIRMIIFSLSNAKMDLDGSPFAFIKLKSDGVLSDELQLANIMAVNSDASEYCLGYENAFDIGLGCEAIESDKVIVSAVDGMLSVSNCKGSAVKIYDISGNLVMSLCPDSNVYLLPLNKGIYLVFVKDQEAVKIIL